jgi:hypothetical protein
MVLHRAVELAGVTGQLESWEGNVQYPTRQDLAPRPSKVPGDELYGNSVAAVTYCPYRILKQIGPY